MGQSHLAAVAALDEISCLQCVVRPSAVTSTFGYFSFRLRGHNLLLKWSPLSIILIMKFQLNTCL